MATFSQAIPRILAAEGGYQANPADTGNYNSLGELIGTNWGISAPVFEAHLNRPPSDWDMKLMPEWEARDIYRDRFWDRIQGDEIENQHLATLIFDGRVNHGTTGVKLLQQSLGISADGIFGPQTLAAVNAANPARLYWSYKDRREEFYRHLAANRPNHQQFLQGWLNRLGKYQDFPRPAGSGPVAAPGNSQTGMILFGLAALAAGLKLSTT